MTLIGGPMIPKSSLNQETHGHGTTDRQTFDDNSAEGELVHRLQICDSFCSKGEELGSHEQQESGCDLIHVF